MKKFIYILVLAVLLFGCKVENKIPESATIIRDYGRGWVEFSLPNFDGTFMFYKNQFGNYDSGITYISK